MMTISESKHSLKPYIMTGLIASNSPGSSDPFKGEGNLGSSLALPASSQEDDGIPAQDGFHLGRSAIGQDGWWCGGWHGHDWV